MARLQVSSDTSAFEVPAALDGAGRLTPACAAAARAMIDAHGFVVLTGLLSAAEADQGLALITATIADPERRRCTFASETDNRHLRRDFCALPASPPVLGFAALLAQRLEAVIGEYCGRSRALLEIITLTSYEGSSHQYLHRDPSGVLSLIAAVEDVSEEQGGTVFVPGTHMHPGAEMRQTGATYALMELFRRRANIGVLCHNLAKLWHMHRHRAPALAPGELRERVFSTRWDQHQPNLLRFVLGKNAEFSLAMLGPRTLWRLYRHRAEMKRLFRLVQSAPRKGTVILYRSDMIHAGPDNRSPRPRRLFGMSIARDIIEPRYWHDGYSPHPSLIAAPLSLGDLLETAPLTLAPSAPPARAATR